MARNPFLPEIKLFDPDVDLAVDDADAKRRAKAAVSVSPFADLLDDSAETQKEPGQSAGMSQQSGPPSVSSEDRSGLEIVEDFDGQVIDI